MRGRERVKKDDWKKVWKKGGWTMEPNNCQAYGPKLDIEDFQIVNELSYLIRFLPMAYITDVILPESNKVGSFKANFKNISLEEFMKFLGLMYVMVVVRLPS